VPSAVRKIGNTAASGAGGDRVLNPAWTDSAKVSEADH
jgi:hypothetical protein